MTLYNIWVVFFAFSCISFTFSLTFLLSKIKQIYGSNMVFHALLLSRSRGRCWKPRPKATVFNTTQGTWWILMHWKTMFDHYYCIKTENICYISCVISCTILFRLPPMSREPISTDFAHSRAGQYTSRDGSNSVAPVRAYWKLRSRALTACELPC